MTVVKVDIIIANECNDLEFSEGSIRLLKEILITCNDVNSISFKKRFCMLAGGITLLNLYAIFPSAAMTIGQYLTTIIDTKKEKLCNYVLEDDIVMAFSSIQHISVICNSLLGIYSSLDYSSEINFYNHGKRKHAFLAQYLLAHMLLPCREVDGQICFCSESNQIRFITNKQIINPVSGLALYHFGERLMLKRYSDGLLRLVLDRIFQEKMFKKLVNFVCQNYQGEINLT